jgi:hypothetical protein
LELTAQQNEGHRQYGADFVHVPGWMGGWMDECVEVKAVLRIAYSNKKWGSSCLEQA